MGKQANQISQGERTKASDCVMRTPPLREWRSGESAFLLKDLEWISKTYINLTQQHTSVTPGLRGKGGERQIPGAHWTVSLAVRESKPQVQ